MYKETKAKYNSATREISELKNENITLNGAQSHLETKVQEYTDKNRYNTDEIKKLSFENIDLTKRFEDYKHG
jgi:chromosome segregation ATPase